MEPTQIPADIAHTMASALVIAGSIRGLVAMLRTPLFAGVWAKLPLWAKPTLLVLPTGVGFAVDAFANGQPWYLALGAALTGLGGAVVSHEWQDLFREAKMTKA